jgi:hypothetical protein
MISGARARRVLVVGLIGAGWLSILGNSPGPEYRRNVVGRTGDITIVPDATNYASACSLSASVFTPVRRFAIFNETDVIREVVCLDGSDCLVRLPYDGQPCEAVVGAPDGATSYPPVPRDSGADGTNPATDGGGTADASAPGIPQTPSIYNCRGAGGRTVQIQVTKSSRASGGDFCRSERATYRLEVETAAGAKSTLQFKIEIEEPPGYFGCD